MLKGDPAPRRITGTINKNEIDYFIFILFFKLQDSQLYYFFLNYKIHSCFSHDLWSSFGPINMK